MREWVLLCGLAACSFRHGELSANGAIDTSSCQSFSSQLDTCAFAGISDFTLTGKTTYDTTQGVLTPSVAITRMSLVGKAGPIEVIFARNVRITAGAALRATGALPLAIVAYGAITIETGALIDVSAGGAGARTMCASGAIAGASNSDGAGGGGGGGFGGTGGDGGNGDSDGASQAPGGIGGFAVARPAGPLGGCPGAHGGSGSDPGGEGGAGGGAIYLVAAAGIEIAASAGIHAGGGGGIGGDQSGSDNGDAGGGGGGSGGMIMIEAPTVRSTGVLAANGGGGGEASGNREAGEDGDPGALATTAANGGSGDSPTGTDGGDGGAQLGPNGAPVVTVQAGGGGGGGGGVGFIVIASPDAMIATASPSP